MIMILISQKPAVLSLSLFLVLSAHWSRLRELSDYHRCAPWPPLCQPNYWNEAPRCGFVPLSLFKRAAAPNEAQRPADRRLFTEPIEAKPLLRSSASLSPFHREKSAVFQRDRGPRSRPAPLWSSVSFIMFLMTGASDKEALWGFSS